MSEPWKIESFSSERLTDEVFEAYLRKKSGLTIVDHARAIEGWMRENIEQMIKLYTEFQKEYPPASGRAGYILVGTGCGKKCPYCPHSLAWKKYDYTRKNKEGKHIFLWRNVPRVYALDGHFLKTRKKSYARFVYYNNMMQLLNARRKKLAASVLNVRRGYQSIISSSVFNAKNDALLRGADVEI
jgi:hypothetical protein